nr:response regulator transcription factor [Paenibacillus sp. ATY16]
MLKSVSIKPAKVLIVYQDKRTLTDLKPLLEKEGCLVEEAKDSRSAFVKIHQANCSLVVLEATIPYPDGTPLCSLIKNENELPVIVLAKTDQQMAESFLAGADDCVMIPFSYKEMILRIKAIIRRYSIKKSEAEIELEDLIRFSHLIIEPSAHRILADHIPVKLTLKEYELLSYMARHPNIVLTKEHLFHTVWKQETQTNYRTIDTHIKRIRDKLSKVSVVSRNMIQTIWGIGYILRDV